MQIVFNVKLPARIHKEGKWFVSFCPLLDLSSQGHTEHEALKNLAEASQLFLVSCFERGTLDRVLKDCGWKAIAPTAHFHPHKIEGQHIDVQLPFSASQKGHAEPCPA